MSDKKEIQDQELQAVNGGFGVIDEDDYTTTCKNCGNSFDQNLAYDKKTVGSGCSKKTIYQCSKCKKWVYSSGEVYDD